MNEIILTGINPKSKMEYLNSSTRLPGNCFIFTKLILIMHGVNGTWNSNVFLSEKAVFSDCSIFRRKYLNSLITLYSGERGGSVVECRTPEREVGGSRPTAAMLCPWARHFTPRKYWLITQEAVAPSRYDWKIVDWDVKLQHKQNKQKHCIPFLIQIRHQYKDPSTAKWDSFKKHYKSSIHIWFGEMKRFYSTKHRSCL